MAETKLRPSKVVEEIRRALCEQRSVCETLRRDYEFTVAMRDVEGLLTCGIVAMHSRMNEFAQIEIAMDDMERGEHLSFRPRGIGTDSGAGCFVCGKELQYGANISAFTSKGAGENIVKWFDARHGGAWLDFRESEPQWVQIKVLACSDHSENLKHLIQITSSYGVIRACDIDDSIAFVKQAIEAK